MIETAQLMINLGLKVYKSYTRINPSMLTSLLGRRLQLCQLC